MKIRKSQKQIDQLIDMGLTFAVVVHKDVSVVSVGAVVSVFVTPTDAKAFARSLNDMYDMYAIPDSSSEAAFVMVDLTSVIAGESYP